MEAARTLAAAESAFAARFGVVDTFVGGTLHHLPTIRRLLWALSRLDRYGDFGRGRAGAGLDKLEQLLDAKADRMRWEGELAPAHLAYFLPELEAEGRRWKHTWAPRIKAEREARGVRRRRRRPQRERRLPAPPASTNAASAKDAEIRRRLLERYRKVNGL